MALLQNTFDAFKFLHWMSVHENLRKPIFTYEIPLVYERPTFILVLLLHTVYSYLSNKPAVINNV